MHLDWILASDSFFGKRDSFFDNSLPKKESLQSKFSTRKTVATKNYTVCRCQLALRFPFGAKIFTICAILRVLDQKNSKLILFSVNYLYLNLMRQT